MGHGGGELKLYPVDPVIVGSSSVPVYAFGLSVSGDYAFVADSIGVKVLDIQIPSMATLVGSYVTPGFARKIAISGDYGYIADDVAGLHVIDITNPASPQYAGSSTDSLVVAADVTISGDLRRGFL